MHHIPSRTRSSAIAILIIALIAGPAVLAQEVDRESLEAFIAERSADVSWDRDAVEAKAARLGLPSRVLTSNGSEAALIGFNETDGRPLYYITHNLNAARTVSTDKVWLGGGEGLELDGTGQVLGEWDGGNIRDTHQELTGRITNLDGSGFSSHATHVAGTMIATGVNASAQGMSYMATIRGYDFFDDEMEMAAEQLEANPISISNHSYGFISGWDSGSFGCPNGADPQPYWFGDVSISTEEDISFGYYGGASATWDQITYDSPYYLPVKSAGNDRNDTAPGGTFCHWDGTLNDGDGGWVESNDTHPGDGVADGGYDSLGGGAGSAKNNLTIGAINDIPGGYTQPSDVVMSSFSGWGPTDDGRIKPDLVANGVALTSSTATSNISYGSFSGTSMSTPNTSGSLGLLNQHSQNLHGSLFKAATMKALVINTADEAGSTPGPDYSFGWGLLNTASAAAALSNATPPSSVRGAIPLVYSNVLEVTLADSATLEYQVQSNGTAPLKVTIAWTDPPGAVPAATMIDPPDAILVNDLDLRIEGPDTTIYEPWVLDPSSPSSAASTGDNFRDNVEQIWIENPNAGIYTLTITHKGSLQDSDPQDVGLVVTGNIVDIEIFSDGFETGDTTAW
ncbi:MAG: S8 family serine peptidase [Thermoanaerobaculia bacterium]|nr:S8 family serine peptidase [Thermoanaerobaculia bacterium]